MNSIASICRLSVAIVGLSFGATPTAQAAIGTYFSAGATCGGASNVNYQVGSSVKVSLCARGSSSEGLCGFTIVLRAANTNESGRFAVTSRTLGALITDPNAPSIDYPMEIRNPHAAVDFGATVANFAPAVSASDQLLATFEIMPRSNATNASYVIGAAQLSGIDVVSSTASNCLPAQEVSFSSSITMVNTGVSQPPPPPPSTQQTPTSLALSSAKNPASYGVPLTLTAAITGNNPTGSVNFALGNTTICSGVPLAAARAGCVVPGSFLKDPNVAFSASYGGDQANAASSGSLQQTVDVNKATLSASANPAQPGVGDAVTLTAFVTARSLGGRIAFSENGVALAGCNSVATALLPGANEFAVATCTIPSISAGSHSFAVSYPNPATTTTEQTALTVAAQPRAPRDYTDMWWGGTAENGWGVSVTQHRDQQFNVLFVYDSTGRAEWYAMPGGTWNASNTVFTGALYLPSSAPFSNYDPAAFRANTSIGTASLAYTSASTATLTYTINGASGSKSIQRQVFGSDDGQPKLLVNDLWWGGNEQNGWGLNIAQQGRVLFPLWYTYDQNGKASWYAVPGGTWSGNTFSGDLFVTNGSGWLGVAYNPAIFGATKIGSMTLTFIDQNNAIMSYVVGGVTQTKTITRQPY